MSRDKNTFDTYINPGDRQIRKIDPPVFVAFIDVRFENETENATAFPEVAFMVLIVMFVRNLGVEW